jgi:hypothetical protein
MGHNARNTMNAMHTDNGGDTIEDGAVLPWHYELTALGWALALLTVFVGAFVLGACVPF